MKNKINLKIITPEGIFLNCLIDILTIKTIAGYISILYNHIPIISIIIPSKIIYKINNKKYKLNICNGILKVEREFINIITDKIYFIY